MPASKVQSEQNQEYANHKVDENLGNGPLQKRSCTDPLCCLFFIAFIGGMIGVASWSLTKGDPNLIIRGYDTAGKICGYDAGYEAYPYLYWTVPNSNYFSQAICLASCPDSPLPSTLASICKPNSSGKYLTSATCTGPNTYSSIATGMAFGNQTGKFYIYNTTAFLGKFCLPKVFVDYSLSTVSAVGNSGASDVLHQWITDIQTTWQVIAAAMGAAFVIGFIYMIFMRWCSGVLTWLAILAFVAGTAVLGWRFFLSAKELYLLSDGDPDDDTANTIQTYKIIAYVCWGVSGFSVLSVLCLFNRIRLAIAIMKAAADYVRETLSIFLVPPTIVVILAAFLVYWGFTALYLVSSGTMVQLSGTPFGTYVFDVKLKRIMIYHLLGLLWGNAFILASTQFIVCSSACIWYFSQGNNRGTSRTVSTSVWRLLRYHLGSIAFGSLILALVQLARIILAYIQYQSKKLAGKENRVLKFFLGCLQCYLACFERFIKFLNKNAYIQIALSGKSFCPSAKDAFLLIMKNPVRLGVVHSIGGIFVLFGKVFVASITALGAYLTITRWDRYSTQVSSPFIPTLVVLIFAYGIGGVFMTVYGLAGDTILACFILDEEIHKKKNGVALHCPESLKTFLDNNRKN